MKTLLFVLAILLQYFSIQAQGFEKIYFQAQDPEAYYLALEPPTQKIEGVLILLPGFGQKPESIFTETDLPKAAAHNGLLIIALGCGPKLYADSLTVSRLNTALKHVLNSYSVDKDDFVIGGFSAGGTIALRYVEYCVQKQEAPVNPQAVFSVDGPVDLFHIWNYFDREIERDYSDVGVAEAKYVRQLMLSEIGDPNSNRDKYLALTPFHAESKSSGNEIYLKDIPVRAYHDIDVNWLLEKRRRSLYDSNALPASALINELLFLGNDRAEFVQTGEPGVRSNGQRHPHSWSIVNSEDCVKWIMSAISN